MYKFINWASIAFLLIFCYSVLSTYIQVLPLFPIGEWGVLPSLAAIAVGQIGFDYAKAKKYANFLMETDIKDFPAIMSALEKADKKAYNIIFEEYSKLVANKLDKLNAYVEDERFRIIDNVKNGKTVSFDIKKETREIYSLKSTKEVLRDIRRHKITWDEIQEKYIRNMCIMYATKYELGEIDEAESKRIKSDAAYIEIFRNGGNNA